MVSRKVIDDFLNGKRIAMVGVSRNEKDFSRALYRDLARYGYEMTPVHSEADEIEGAPCAKRVQDVIPAVDGVLLMTKPAVTDEVVKDCVEAGVKRVWMYGAVGPGAVSKSAVEYCEANGVDVVPGECPYMFLDQAPWFHKLHGFLLKIVGKYPQ